MDGRHISEPSGIAALSLLLILLLTSLFYRISNSNNILVAENKPNRFHRAWECMSFTIDTHLSQLLMKVQGVYQIAEAAMLFLPITLFCKVARWYSDCSC